MATLEEGWLKYGEGNFAEACECFAAVLQSEPDAFEAHNGMGWCALRQLQGELAAGSFSEALALEPTLADAAVGLSAAYAALGRHDESAGAAEVALSLDPEYACAHDPVGAADVLRALIISQAILGDELAAANALDRLEPSHGLDPYVPETWLVEAERHPTFLRAALAFVLSPMEASP